jgi:thiol-disulfide isomerase/thioredoxin
VTRVALTPFREIDRAILRSVVRNPIQAPAGSSGIPLGVQAPSFELSDALGETFRTEDFRDAPVLVVVFVSNSCPLSKHIQSGLSAFASDYQKHQVVTVAINSNDPTRYPEDSIESISAEVASSGYGFAYLIDVKQEVAKAFLADSTPDFYVFGADRKLAYQGRFDDSMPGEGKAAAGSDLRHAVDALLVGSKVPSAPRTTGGCPITWVGATPAAPTPATSSGDVVETDRGTVVVERRPEPTGAISGTMSAVAAIVALPFKVIFGIFDILF